MWRAGGTRGRYLPRGHDDRLDAREFERRQVVFVDIAPDNESLRELRPYIEAERPELIAGAG